MSERLRIAFLVYDSRSGSTLLARAMAEQLSNVVVTPEISFMRLLREAGRRGGWLDARRAVALLSAPATVRNLGVPASRLRSTVLEAGPRTDAATAIDAVLRAHLGSTAVATGWVVVKSGLHVKVWHEIHRLLGGAARFIHIYRDPRAVVSSKLRTIRPYQPYETMAWYGAAGAGWRWRAFSRAMREAGAAGVPLIEVRYEDLIADPSDQLSRIARFLGVSLRSTPLAGAYEVPDAEKAIHRLAVTGRIDAQRAASWREELRPRDVRVVEAIVGNEMTRRGYAGTSVPGAVRRLLTVAEAGPETVGRIAAHVWRRWRHRSPAAHGGLSGIAVPAGPVARSTPAPGSRRTSK